MPMVFIRAAAQRDLVGHFDYLAEHVGLHVAERFLLSAEANFLALAEQPKCKIHSESIC
jgi:plasmid stabilization system protein ParE